jgi:ATP-dependent DNA helicase RecG
MQLIRQKENIRLEFKEAANALPANLFETICAMLNREGGDIILGVDNKNILRGVNPGAVQTMVTNIVNLSNNPQKLDPPFILFPQTYTIDDKIIIHIQVPSSSQLHKTSNIVFDRSNDGDFKVTQAHRIAQLYNIKTSFYTENIIFPYLKFEDFKKGLFTKARNLITSYNDKHPWRKLKSQQLLEIAGLWRRDNQANQEGYTLAAALLFGKDQVIQSILPHYKIDALVRKRDIYRYDDREYIQTNLIDAYDQLMDFIAKHLPDRFFLINHQRVSLRSKIFREG